MIAGGLSRRPWVKPYSSAASGRLLQARVHQLVCDCCAPHPGTARLGAALHAPNSLPLPGLGPLHPACSCLPAFLWWRRRQTR